MQLDRRYLEECTTSIPG